LGFITTSGSTKNTVSLRQDIWYLENEWFPKYLLVAAATVDTDLQNQPSRQRLTDG